MGTLIERLGNVLAALVGSRAGAGIAIGIAGRFSPGDDFGLSGLMWSFVGYALGGGAALSVVSRVRGLRKAKRIRSWYHSPAVWFVLLITPVTLAWVVVIALLPTTMPVGLRLFVPTVVVALLATNLASKEPWVGPASENERRRQEIDLGPGGEY